MSKSFDMSETAITEKPAPDEKKLLEENYDDVELIETYLSSFLSNLQGTSVPTEKPKLELRASGLPFCPILAFLRTEQEENFNKSFYTSTGTAIHTTIQNWLSINKLTQADMYGSWKCSACGNIKLNQMYPKSKCKCSNKLSKDSDIRRIPKFWQYEEVEVDYNGLTMHVDLIVAIRPDFWVVVDVKTTALAIKKGGWFWSENKPSSLSYVTQIRTYSTILDKVHGLPIKGWCLAVIDRNKPIEEPDSMHLIPGAWNRSKSNRWIKYLDQSIVNFNELKKLEEAVEKENKVKAKKHLKTIILNRPCMSEGEYSRYMAYKFFGKKECKLVDICTKGRKNSKKVFTEVQRILNEMD